MAISIMVVVITIRLTVNHIFFLFHVPSTLNFKPFAMLLGRTQHNPRWRTWLYGGYLWPLIYFCSRVDPATFES